MNWIGREWINEPETIQAIRANNDPVNRESGDNYDRVQGICWNEREFGRVTSLVTNPVARVEEALVNRIRVKLFPPPWSFRNAHPTINCLRLRRINTCIEVFVA
jgi:hypothetical protein